MRRGNTGRSPPRPAGRARPGRGRSLTTPAPATASSPIASPSRPSLTQWHEHPALIAWWTERIQPVEAILPAERRRLLLSAIAVVACLGDALGVRDVALGRAARLVLVAPLLLALAAGITAAARNFRTWPAWLRRRPQIVLHLGFWLLWCVLWGTARGAPGGGGGGNTSGPGDATGLARSVATAVAVLLPPLLWRLGYLLKSGQRGKAGGTTLRDHAFYLWPLWGGSETPYGKGLEFLSRHEARSATALARAQLAGIKLLLLALLWKGALFVMAGAVYGDPDNGLARWLGPHTLGVPRLDDLVRRRATTPLAVAWIGIYCDLVWSTLRLAAKGHVIVGVLRLLGFQVFRNTYKPLLAESILEFWNRYYFYFKELLAEFFFYPTYLRTSGPAWLRTALATFAAAFVGNLYYHLIQQEGLFLAADAPLAWATFQSRTIYCSILAFGIAVSMLREQRRRGRESTAPAPGAARRLARIAGVWTFFALIHVWAHASAEPTLAERSAFVASLFGF